MPSSSSADAFLRLVSERFKELRDRLSDLMAVLALENRDDKAARARAALDRAQHLEAALATGDRPSWLVPLIAAVQNYSNVPHNPVAAGNLVTTLAQLYPTIDAHKWGFDFSGMEPFDFDGLYERYRDESRIPELFDNLIEILEQVVRCEDLDSRKIIHGLETLIATLRKNRTGSYFSLMCTWDFVRTYLINAAWETLSALPVLGPPIKALRTTMAEMDARMERLQEGMKSELRDRVRSEFPSLGYRPLALPAEPPGEPALYTTNP